MSISVYPLVRVQRISPYRLSLDALAGRTGVHPQLIQRFVDLGLLDADRDRSGRLWFTPAAPALVARIQRLHAGLSLNYTSIGLVLDLLERIDRLEAALRRNGLSPKE
jgi:DNA-binding transcriptional MerR regulator